MIRVAVVDDTLDICSDLERILFSYADSRRQRISVDVFYSGNGFVSAVRKNGLPDILFLDIMFPEGRNGVKIGQLLRREDFGEGMFMIYISAQPRYAMELFQNRPVDFLLKPLQPAKVFEVMDYILRVMGTEKYFFEFQNRGVYSRILTGDILYFGSEGKKIRVVWRDGEKEFYGKLEDVERSLPKDQFLRIHKSWLVNKNQVEEYTYEAVKMRDGTVLSISKANRPEIRKRMLGEE